MATVIQTQALSLQRDEHHQAAAGDSDHLSAIQSMMMQYLGLYLSWVSANQKCQGNMLSRPAALWLGVALLFPSIGVVTYPIRDRLLPLFLFFGAVGSNLANVHLLRVKPGYVLP
jgi:hypothetical protein